MRIRHYTQMQTDTTQPTYYPRQQDPRVQRDNPPIQWEPAWLPPPLSHPLREQLFQPQPNPPENHFWCRRKYNLHVVLVKFYCDVITRSHFTAYQHFD